VYQFRECRNKKQTLYFSGKNEKGRGYRVRNGRRQMAPAGDRQRVKVKLEKKVRAWRNT